MAQTLQKIGFEIRHVRGSPITSGARVVLALWSCPSTEVVISPPARSAPSCVKPNSLLANWPTCCRVGRSLSSCGPLGEVRGVEPGELPTLAAVLGPEQHDEPVGDVQQRPV
jgi:hypothetical protein